MRIHFSSEGILVQNAKRTVELIREVQVRDPRYNAALPQVNLTKTKTALAKAYGYTDIDDLQLNLSSTAPQLKDLSNQERLHLEQSIMVNLGGYLMQCGMPSNMAYSIAFSVASYLDNRLVKKIKLKRPKEYATCKKLSADFGLTVPEFKKILIGVKSLNGIFPSKKAIKKGWCAVSVVINSHGVKPKVLWSTDYINNSFLTLGVKKPIDYKRFIKPRHLHNADTIFGRHELELVKILKSESNWAYSCSHPVAHFAMSMDSPKERALYLKGVVAGSLLAARKINPEKTKLIELSLEKVINWISYYQY